LAYLISGGVLLALAGAGMGLDAKRMSTQVVRCLAPTAIAALVLAGVAEFILGKHLTADLGEVLRLGLACIAFVGAYLVFSLPFTRGIGFRTLAIESNLPVISALARRSAGRPEDPRP
ncbi:MAG: hypothetical protein K8R56_07980, partial [Candidatus Eisenbacteria bacterium]|nr:hypothetical protein [Candidatus Eisenbacteria bacterium]